MISWADVKQLREEQVRLQLQLDTMLKSGSASSDEITALKSEILHVKNQIQQIVGKNEMKRQEKVKGRNSEQRAINAYRALKKKYDKIRELGLAVTRMLNCIDKINGYSLFREQPGFQMVRTR